MRAQREQPIAGQRQTAQQAAGLADPDLQLGFGQKEETVRKALSGMPAFE